ncbi:MAG: hypothetical protein U0Y68_21140 [Blastocatellia bacterium]
MLLWVVCAALNPVWLPLWKILLPATLVFLLGVADDVFGVSERLKLFVPAVSAALLHFTDTPPALSLIPGENHSHSRLAKFDLAGLWVMSVTNALNLIDGVDGLAVGVSGVAVIALLLSALLCGQVEGFALSLLLLPALCGFLPHNFHPRQFF